MAKPKQETELPTPTAATTGPLPKQKVLAKVFHMAIGLDLIGSKTSLSDKRAELEVTPLGVKMTSKENGRVVLIPWTNIKGVELHPEPKS